MDDERWRSGRSLIDHRSLSIPQAVGFPAIRAPEKVGTERRNGRRFEWPKGQSDGRDASSPGRWIGFSPGSPIGPGSGGRVLVPPSGPIEGMGCRLWRGGRSDALAGRIYKPVGPATARRAGRIPDPRRRVGRGGQVVATRDLADRSSRGPGSWPSRSAIDWPGMMPRGTRRRLMMSGGPSAGSAPMPIRDRRRPRPPGGVRPLGRRPSRGHPRHDGSSKGSGDPDLESLIRAGSECVVDCLRGRPTSPTIRARPVGPAIAWMVPNLFGKTRQEAPDAYRGRLACRPRRSKLGPDPDTPRDGRRHRPHRPVPQAPRRFGQSQRRGQARRTRRRVAHFPPAGERRADDPGNDDLLQSPSQALM